MEERYRQHSTISRQHGNTREIFWYGTYEQPPFDPKLFAKPSDVKIEEAK